MHVPWHNYNFTVSFQLHQPQSTLLMMWIALWWERSLKLYAGLQGQDLQRTSPGILGIQEWKAPLNRYDKKSLTNLAGCTTCKCWSRSTYICIYSLYNFHGLVEIKLVANLIWYSFQKSSDGNTTVSILSFWPKMEHIGKDLMCKAANPLISQSDIADKMKLKIDCKWNQSSNATDLMLLL